MEFLPVVRPFLFMLKVTHLMQMHRSIVHCYSVKLRGDHKNSGCMEMFVLVTFNKVVRKLVVFKPSRLACFYHVLKGTVSRNLD
jgi:hypothetical protein